MLETFQKIFLLVPGHSYYAQNTIVFKKIFISCKNSTFTQNNSMRALLEIFSSVFIFYHIDIVAINENVEFINQASENQFPDFSKSTINWKNNDDVLIC